MDKVKIRHSFAFKLSLYIVTCIVVTFISVLIYNDYASRDIIMKDIKENVDILAALTFTKIRGALHAAQQVVEGVPHMLAYSKFTEEELLNLLKDIVKENDEICACTICFEPYTFDKTKYYFDPCFYNEGGIVKYLELHNDSKYKDYFKSDWYTSPKKLNKGVWSGPYLDEKYENMLMLAYSHPFYKTINGKREFAGVVAGEVDLEWLGKFIAGIKIFKTGYIFVLSPKGDYIEHKNRDYTRLGENIFSLAEKKGDLKLKELGRKMVDNQTGFEAYYSYTLGKECFVFYAPLKDPEWSVGIVIPKDELFSDLNDITLKLFIIGLIGHVLILTLIIILATGMTIPLRTLAGATCEIGEGNFNAVLPSISSKDEVGILSHSFHRMQESLIKYIANLQETTAAKEKIEKELSIASEIQQSLLPHKFPHLKQIDLYATLIPAKEVGGDLYDFFFIDEKHLCFAIGDVAGKGVPAALFMAVVKTLLRAKLGLTMDPAKVFSAMNEDLSRENESYMFVTFFLGVLDIETGLLEYCNAGHNPPLIHTANKDFYYFHTEDAQPPLGIVTNVSYVGNRLKLLPEDIFFLYTDGVTEAMATDNVQFSEEKLLNVLTRNRNETVSDIINNIKTTVVQYTSGAVQSDDIAMLILKYNG